MKICEINQSKIQQNIQVNNTKNISFEGFAIPKFLRKPTNTIETTVTLSSAAQINKESLEWLNKNLHGKPDTLIKEVYNACLNPDNNICKQAIDILKKYIPEQKTGLRKFFDFSSSKPNAYTKFGLNFMLDMLKGSKNIYEEHTTENLKLLDTVLENYKTDLPRNMLNVIIDSKDKEGNSPQGAAKIFKIMYVPEAFDSISKFKSVMYKLHSATKLQRDILCKHFKSYDDFLSLRLLMNYCLGDDSEKILKSVDKDLEKYDAKTLCEVVANSQINTTCRCYPAVSYNNYKAILPYANNDRIFGWIWDTKDAAGNINNEALRLIGTVYEKTKSSIHFGEYLKLIKKKDGTIDTDKARYIADSITENCLPSDFKDYTEILELLKNKQGKIQSKYGSQLIIAKRAFSVHCPQDKIPVFYDVVNVIKDKDGNIIPEFMDSLVDLIRNHKLSIELPNLLQLCKIQDKLQKDNLDKALKVLDTIYSTEKKDMVDFLWKCLDSNGNLDISKTQIFADIKKCGVKTNIMKIAAALQNPDGQSSKRGFNFMKQLTKDGDFNQEELPKLLATCRDKTGYLNDKTMQTALALHEIRSRIHLSSLIKFVLDSNKEVNDNNVKIVSEILKSGNIKNVRDIGAIFELSKDKNDVVDMQVLKRLSTLAGNGENISHYADVIPAYRKLYKYEYATSLSQLNLRQKRTLMQALREYQNEIQSPYFDKMLRSKIIPSNDSEYCSTMGRLSHSIGIHTEKLPKETVQNFYKAMNNLADPKQGFVHLDFNNETPVLNLAYPLADFKHDVWNLVKNEHYSDRNKALDYFGFELRNNNGNIELTGYPNTDKPDGRLAEIKDNNIRKLINKINPYVIKFTQNNPISIQNHPNIAKNLNEVMQAFPEFLTTIGRVQHGTHDFTLDVHLLKVLQSVFNNPNYAKLSDESKKHIQIAALLHDLTKAEKQVDFEHPRNSAFDVYYLLDKLNMSEKDKLKIYHIIANHDWLARYDFSGNKSKRIAFHLREGDAFRLSTILTQADLKGVQKNDKFYLKHAQKLDSAYKGIQEQLFNLQASAINLPQAKVPKASELNTKSSYVSLIKTDGIRNTVLDLRGCHDLGNVGFKTCKDINDFNVLVHGLGSKDASSMFQALGAIDSNALLSSSYVIYSKGNYRAFRQEGFVLDVPAMNTHVAYWRDFGSGYKKSTKDLYTTYLFQDNPMRNYISGELKQKLHLSDREYITLFRKIEDMPLEKLEKDYPQVAKAYREIFKEMEVSKRTYGRNYNEILVTNPQIQGIFCYNKKPENISIYLRRYAERNDIPIIVFG